MLDQGIKEFQAANYESREIIVEDKLAICKSTWPGHFDHHGERDMKTVCTPLATFGCSQIFLVYPTAPIQQSKTSDRWQNPN
jgi:hypothetical protein